MRLVRYGPAGKEKPGLIDSEGKLRDLSRKVKDISPEALAPAKLKELSRLDPKKLPLVKGRPRFGPCVTGVPKFVAIGLNYVDHAKESGNPIPEYPVVFYKAETCIVGANDNIMLPPDSTHTDWEVELGVIIGKTARYVDKKDAFKHVAGYCIVNDVSEREYQMGPWLVTTDEIKDPQNLDLWLDVNGEKRQRGNTRTMIFGVAELVADVSKYMTLLPGDIITTGTPPGVGMGMKPEPKYLKAGDVVTLGITGLGEQRQTVVAFKGKGRK
jgi:2-keto-4-pentenoate hydratase/2-oxohepta-3-ene-1,7-dioic acid hydratase in catechol pathway